MSRYITEIYDKVRVSYIPASKLDLSKLAYPSTQSYGICFTETNEIFTIKKTNESYSLIGGTIDPGESPQDALIREFFEEVTIKLDPESLHFTGANFIEYLE